MTVDVHLFSVGHCRNRAWLVESGSLFQQLHLPAMVALIHHADAGLILFDTGYGQPLVNAESLAAKLYRLLLPFEVNAEHGIPYHLWSLGYSPSDISTIFLSHFHPDHIGSLQEMPPVPVLHSQTGLTTLAKYTGPQRARAAFFPELLPDDFPERARAIEGLPVVQLDASWLPFTEGYDVAGDGSMVAIALPGHAVGQYGLLCRRTKNRWVFLVADAAWTRRNITELALPGWPAGALIGDPPAFRATLKKLHDFQRLRPDVPLIPSHCQESIEAYQYEQ
jgi:glyoxylase-like metal-dependent hydrolase (beta-lactamase superfamily II)